MQLLNKDLKSMNKPAKWIVEERPFRAAGTACAKALSQEYAFVKLGGQCDWSWVNSRI